MSKLNSTGSGLVFSTYLGGATNTDTATSIALGPGLTVHVAGRTISTDFPTTAGAFDTTFNGGAQDGFEAKLNAAGSGLDYSTYLGGTGEEILVNVAVDPAGNAYVGGGTSSADYPTTAGAFDPIKDASTDVFVTKLNTTGTAPVYSTFIGGGSSDIAARHCCRCQRECLPHGRHDVVRLSRQHRGVRHDPQRCRRRLRLPAERGGLGADPLHLPGNQLGGDGTRRSRWTAMRTRSSRATPRGPRSR